ACSFTSRAFGFPRWPVFAEPDVLRTRFPSCSVSASSERYEWHRCRTQLRSRHRKQPCRPHRSHRFDIHSLVRAVLQRCCERQHSTAARTRLLGALFGKLDDDCSRGDRRCAGCSNVTRSVGRAANLRPRLIPCRAEAMLRGKLPRETSILAADSLVAKAAYCSTHSGLQRLFPG